MIPNRPFYLAADTAQTRRARSSQRDSKSPKLTLREHITLFGCAVLVVGSLVVDAIREWRKA
jgi:hypothetical protein